MLAGLQRKASLVSDDPQLPSREAMLALNRSATAARLMAGAIHEVNNALQVISGTVELLQGRTDLLNRSPGRSTACVSRAPRPAQPSPTCSSSPKALSTNPPASTCGR